MATTMMIIKQKHVFSFLLAIVITCIFISPASAAGVPDAPPEGLVDPLLEIIENMAVSILRFCVFLGSTIFILTVVVSAARGSLGTALGNQMNVSRSIITAISAVGAFILVLVAVPLSNHLINSVAVDMTSSISAETLSQLTASVSTADLEVSQADLSAFLEIPELHQTITDFTVTVIKALITIGIIAFVLSVMLGAIDTQLATLMGGGGMAGRGIMRIIASVASLIFLLSSYPLSEYLIRTLVPRILPGIGIQIPSF